MAKAPHNLGLAPVGRIYIFFLRIFYCHFLDIFVSLELEGIGAGGRSHHIFIPHCIFRDYEKQETEQRMQGPSKD